jgi:hypothetical protein
MKMGSEKRALNKIYKRRDRYEIPEWQRAEVWTDDRKQLLIDTILRGWKIPKFYFAKVSELDFRNYAALVSQARRTAWISSGVGWSGRGC